MVTICAVLKSGGDYTPEYVARLRAGVKQHCTIPHKFICFTDIPDQVEADEVIPLQRNWHGWWSKLEIFRVVAGSVVYFDLDTVITGSIDEFVSYPHQFTMLSNLDGRGGLASGVLAFNGDYRYLYHGFDMSMADDYKTPRRWGDQGFLAEKIKVTPERAQDICPAMFASYKWGTIEQKQTAAVVIYHGLPRPHQTGWKV